MKYTFVLMLAFLATFGYSQDTTDAKVDTTRIKIGGTQVIIISDKDKEEKVEKKTTKVSSTDTTSVKKKKKKHRNKKSIWSGLQLGIASFEQIGNGTNAPDPLWEQDVSRSRHFAYNFYSRRMDLGTPYVGLSTGLGVEFYRYAFNQNVRVSHNSDKTWTTLDTLNQLTKSYLKTTHLTLPLILEFNTKKDADDGFRLAIGLEAAYLLRAKTKVQYKRDGQRQTDKARGNFNIEPFKFSPTVILGYKNLSFYGKADLNPLFKTGKAPTINTGSLGLMWSFH